MVEKHNTLIDISYAGHRGAEGPAAGEPPGDDSDLGSGRGVKTGAPYMDFR